MVGDDDDGGGGGSGGGSGGGGGGCFWLLAPPCPPLTASLQWMRLGRPAACVSYEAVWIARYMCTISYMLRSSLWVARDVHWV